MKYSCSCKGSLWGTHLRAIPCEVIISGKSRAVKMAK